MIDKLGWFAKSVPLAVMDAGADKTYSPVTGCIVYLRMGELGELDVQVKME